MINNIKTGLSIAAIAWFAVALPVSAKGPLKPGQALVGTWTLLSDVNKAPDGSERSLFGEHPLGQIIFASDGRYASYNSRSDLPKFAANNRMQGTPDEYKAIGQGSLGSFGRYRVSADGKTLYMTPEASSFPNWNGTEQQRSLTLAGNEMSYSLQASAGGVSTLTYRRAK